MRRSRTARWRPTQQAIANGADVDERDRFGRTPLLQAVLLKCHEIAEFLISRGADLNAVDKAGASALDRAVRTADLEMLNILVKAGAALGSCEDLRHTAWYSAIGKPEIADALMDTPGAIRVRLTAEEREIVESVLYAEASTEDSLSVLASPELLHGFVARYNWDDGPQLMLAAVKSPMCSEATALLIYDRADPEHFEQYDSRHDVPEYEQDVFDLLEQVRARYPGFDSKPVRLTECCSGPEHTRFQNRKGRRKLKRSRPAAEHKR